MDKTSEQFFIEFTGLFDQVVMNPAKLLMVGDLNAPWDVQRAPHTKCLTDLLHSLDLPQAITEPRHEDGHTIDLVVYPQTDNLFQPSFVSCQSSGHRIAHSILNIVKSSVPC